MISIYFPSLLKAFDANPIITSMSFVLSAIYKPRYLKSPTCFNISPSSFFKYVSAWLNIIIIFRLAAQRFFLQFPILIALFLWLFYYKWMSSNPLTLKNYISLDTQYTKKCLFYFNIIRKLWTVCDESSSVYGSPYAVFKFKSLSLLFEHFIL